MNDQVTELIDERSLQARMQEIIFEADTPAGKAFDVALIICILLSVLVVMLDSVAAIEQRWGGVLYGFEWGFTLLFTAEYILRLWCVRRPWRYARSFYGVVDLICVVPTYISPFLPGSQFLLVIRILRVLRIFRVLKLVTYVGEVRFLTQALRASRRKIAVFLLTLLILVVLLGSFMYMIEGRENGFDSIPHSIYWAIVTLTTVGYGDISPQTPLGRTLASVIMILGYSIIAVPTGIVTFEMAGQQEELSTQACPDCGAEGHDPDAVYCKYCGAKI
ncbi:MAG: ion transporter [Spartobacteria bacterium]|nr:ion transporter [Spartobacteria bacterium]